MPNNYTLPKRNLVTQEGQSIIARPDVPRSKFITNWGHQTTFNAGDLIPFMVEEVLPGDHLKYKVHPYVRMATPLFPLYSNQKIETFFFFCPNRLVWENWVRMMGQQDNPTSSINYTVPVITMPNGGFAVHSLYDHMELPTVGQIQAGKHLDPNALPARAYTLIWKEWFRDQNLIDGDSIIVGIAGDGPDAASKWAIQKRAKTHDYFTSALPWAQKFTAPTVPLGDRANVLGIGNSLGTSGGGPHNVYDATGAYVAYNPSSYVSSASEGPAGNELNIKQKLVGGNYVPDIYADLSASTGISINTFRQAFLVQQLLERDARGGTRYTEIVKAHFGVDSPDARMMRPEYIGGGSSPLNVTPVANTSNTNLGALGGAATSYGQHTASYAATEHGFIIGIINVRTELAYQQGMARQWNRRTRYDYYWPSLAGLGEQAILRKEIYARGEPTEDDLVFGYQERWQEYRTRPSAVTGLFRSTTTGNIDEWHLAQEFGAAPTLGATFIIDNPPMARVLAAGSSADNQQYLADILIEREAVRPIPTFGTPALLGRF